MSEETLQPIEVSRLRVGMFVHLDLSWRQHPFPFNSFKLKNAEQIETIQSLGVAEVRWSPRKSDVQPETVRSAVLAPAAAPALVVAPAAKHIEVAADPVIVLRREQLSRQQAHLARCESQFSDASQKFRVLQQSVRSDPEGARDAAEDVVEGMAAELEDDRETAIRLLSEHVGEDVSLHAVNVTVLSMLLAKACALDGKTLRDIAIGSLLHDIGKLELPGFLRWGNDRLSEHEQRAVQKHVEFGVETGRRMGLSRSWGPTSSNHMLQRQPYGFRAYPWGLWPLPF
jgi:putative nucleotidyltransferase with HDIG domain